MTADENQRIGSLERAVAKMEQRVDDLSGAVKDLSPLALAVARVEGTVARAVLDVRSLETRLGDLERHFDEKIDAVAKLVSDDKRERDQAQRQAQREARNNRWSLWIGAALVALTAAANIVVQLVVPG